MSEPTTLLRFNELQARGIVRNREQLRNLIRDHSFPPGFMLTPNAHVFEERAVEAWLIYRRTVSDGSSAEVQRDALRVIAHAMVARPPSFEAGEGGYLEPHAPSTWFVEQAYKVHPLKHFSPGVSGCRPSESPQA